MWDRNEGPANACQEALQKTGLLYVSYGDGDYEAVIDLPNGQAHLLAAGGVHGVTIRPDGSMEPAHPA